MSTISPTQKAMDYDILKRKWMQQGGLQISRSYPQLSVIEKIKLILLIKTQWGTK
jgi:hypothetical protein